MTIEARRIWHRRGGHPRRPAVWLQV